MTIFSKKQSVWDKPFPEKLANRVAKIPTSDLDIWVEQSIIELSRCMSLYNKKRDLTYLEEAAKGAEAMHAVVEELKKRMTR